MEMLSIKALVAAFGIMLSSTHDAPFKGVQPPPIQVEFRTDQQLCEMQFADRCSDDDTWEFAALYINNVMYLNEDCDYVLDQYCQSVILHELVHHYQDYSDVDYWRKCDVDPIAPMEAEAYEIQIKWLEEQGLDPWVFLDGLSVLSAGVCPHVGNVR